MVKKNSLDHAKHNLQVCNYLNKKPQYTDWTITVAFYSAMKFLEHKIFPLKMLINSTPNIVQNFDDYYKFEYLMKGSNINKHAAFVRLVDQYASGVSSNYRWLKDTAYTARYNNYEYGRSMAKHAQVHLEKIKLLCV